MPKVLPMNRPQQRFRCYLDRDLIYADADTGSQLNLISLEFATQRGLKIHQREREMVMLADGSTAELSGVYQTRFFPFKTQTSHLRPPEEVYYILEGLTTDVLIDAELLFEQSAFKEQQSAFVDLEEQGTPPNINTIAWLSKREKNLLNASNIERLNKTPSTATDLDVAFQIDLSDDDAREHLQQANDSKTSPLGEPA